MGYDLYFINGPRMKEVLAQPEFEVEDLGQGDIFLHYVNGGGFAVNSHSVLLDHAWVNYSGSPYGAALFLYKKFGCKWHDDHEKIFYDGKYVHDDEYDAWIDGICSSHMIWCLKLKPDDCLFWQLKEAVEFDEKMDRKINRREKRTFKYIWKKIKNLLTKPWLRQPKTEEDVDGMPF